MGDQILYQPYFVCVTQEPDATIIEYGKSQGTTEKGEIYLSMIDKEKTRLHVRFYAFGNGEDALEITDAHVLKRSLIKAECKGDTTKDVGTHMCIQKCHEMCDPLKGMTVKISVFFISKSSPWDRRLDTVRSKRKDNIDFRIFYQQTLDGALV